MNVLLIWMLIPEKTEFYYFDHSQVTNEEVDKIKESHEHYVNTMIDAQTEDHKADWLSDWLVGKDSFKTKGPIEITGNTIVVVSGFMM